MKAKKKILIKAILIPVGVILLAFLTLLAYLTLTEYNPADIEPLAVAGSEALTLDGEHTVLSFNIGYAGLDAYTDFFMDGGTMSLPRSKEAVEENIDGIGRLISGGYEIIMLQEVDRRSNHAYFIDQVSTYESVTGMNSYYAPNYVCKFVPYPLPPIGEVNCGICTYTNLAVSEAARVSLPVPFSWPLRIANLKRCLLILRFDIEGSDRQLVLINLHLEAFDNGEGKAAQTAALRAVLAEEYARGNYVIAGGDFNHNVEGAPEYPVTAPWQAGLLTADDLPDGFSFHYGDTASCRSLDTPYEEGRNQLYLIDYFIVSDNIDVKSTVVLDEGFRYSDHNPTVLTYSFRK